MYLIYIDLVIGLSYVTKDNHDLAHVFKQLSNKFIILVDILLVYYLFHLMH